MKQTTPRPRRLGHMQEAALRRFRGGRVRSAEEIADLLGGYPSAARVLLNRLVEKGELVLVRRRGESPGYRKPEARPSRGTPSHLAIRALRSPTIPDGDAAMSAERAVLKALRAAAPERLSIEALAEATGLPPSAALTAAKELSDGGAEVASAWSRKGFQAWIRPSDDAIPARSGARGKPAV